MNLISEHLNVRFGNSYKKSDYKRNDQKQEQVSFACKSRAYSFTDRLYSDINANQKYRKSCNQQNSACNKLNDKSRTDWSNRKPKYEHDCHNRQNRRYCFLEF